MEPVNVAERKTAFVYFLILFLITTSIAVLAVFFGMQVPFQKNEKLEQQLSIYQSQRSFAENFSAKLTDTRILLDSINHAGVQADVVDGKISGNLVDLNTMIDKDTSGVKEIYKNIVRDLTDLKDAKAQLREASSKDAAVGQYLQQIDNLKGQLNTKQAEADMLRSQVISLSSH